MNLAPEQFVQNVYQCAGIAVQSIHRDVGGDYAIAINQKMPVSVVDFRGAPNVYRFCTDNCLCR